MLSKKILKRLSLTIQNEIIQNRINFLTLKDYNQIGSICTDIIRSLL